MKIKNAAIGGLAALSLLLAACGGLAGGPPSIKEGKVTEKNSEPGEYETKKVNKCTGYGKKRKCKTKTVEEWDDPDFEIVIQGCITYDKDKENCETRTIEVSESEYNSVEVGDTYKVG